MNAVEFRAVLDWWYETTIFPAGVSPPAIKTINEWLEREAKARGFRNVVDACHKASADAPGPPTKLTEKQRFVFDLLIRGRTNQQIAEDLRCAEKTVKAHVTAIFKVVDCRSRSQVIALYANNSGVHP